MSAAPEPAIAAAAEEALIVRAGRARRLLRLREVRELVRLATLTPLPGAPPEVLGLASVRGEILTVLCLRRVLGEEAVRERERDERRSGFLAVAEGGSLRFALAFDDVVGTLRAGSAWPEDLSALDLAALAEQTFAGTTLEEDGSTQPEEAIR